MTIWFDSTKGRYRVSFNDGVKRRTKLLPAGLTDEEARAAHSRFCGEVYMGRLAIPLDVELRWKQSIDTAEAKSRSWITALLDAARKRAKKKRLPFLLSLAELVAICRRSAGRCEVTGIEFTDRSGNGRMRPFITSLDRRVPANCYTADNCRLVCACVNVAMFTWGEDVFRAMAFGFTMGELAKSRGMAMPKMFPPLPDPDLIEV